MGYLCGILATAFQKRLTTVIDRIEHFEWGVKNQLTSNGKIQDC